MAIDKRKAKAAKAKAPPPKQAKVGVLVTFRAKQESGWLYTPRWNLRKGTLEIIRSKLRGADAPPAERPTIEIVWTGTIPDGHPVAGMHYWVIDSKLTCHRSSRS